MRIATLRAKYLEFRIGLTSAKKRIKIIQRDNRELRAEVRQLMEANRELRNEIQAHLQKTWNTPKIGFNDLEKRC